MSTQKSKPTKQMTTDSVFQSKQMTPQKRESTQMMSQKRCHSVNVNKAESLVYVDYSAQRKPSVEGMI